jgi:very-short-patch-repair endonuclease
MFFADQTWGKPLKHDFARQLRRNQTDVERQLWYALRDRGFGGFKFRRQQPIGPYIADFVCFEARLVIELDGSQHGLPENVAADEKRTEYLRSDGFRVKRFANYELIEDFDAVLMAIFHELEIAALTPHQQNPST